MRQPPDFEDLLTDYGKEIYAYLWRTLNGQPEAEDCFQETFLKAFKAYESLGSPWNYRAWLYRIATNTANSHLRQVKREKDRWEEWGREIPSPGNSVPEVVGDLISLAEIEAALEKLPNKQRLALILRKYQGLQYDEIAEILGTTPPAARANVYQGLKKLRAQFQNQNGTGLSGQQR